MWTVVRVGTAYHQKTHEMHVIYVKTVAELGVLELRHRVIVLIASSQVWTELLVLGLHLMGGLEGGHLSQRNPGQAMNLQVLYALEGLALLWLELSILGLQYLLVEVERTPRQRGRVAGAVVLSALARDQRTLDWQKPSAR